MTMPPADTDDEGLTERTDCFACRHFYITHAPSFPYGCRRIGFQSRQLPCVEVRSVSGTTCSCFSPKERMEGNP